MDKGILQIEKFPKKWKKAKMGGISAGNQKGHNSKCELFDKRERRPNFQFFPYVNDSIKQKIMDFFYFLGHNLIPWLPYPLQCLYQQHQILNSFR